MKLGKSQFDSSTSHESSFPKEHRDYVRAFVAKQSPRQARRLLPEGRNDGFSEEQES